jgi:hypothetical protein
MTKWGTMVGYEVGQLGVGGAQFVEHNDDARQLDEFRLPDTMTDFVSVADYVPEVEAKVLELVRGHDVVLVARGGELAGYMAKRFRNLVRRLSVVNFLNDGERERCLSWLSALATESPREKVWCTFVGLHPVCGHPSVMHGGTELASLVDIAAHMFKPGAPGDELNYGGRPANLWLEIPLDYVPSWLAGRNYATEFDVPAEQGTLRVELEEIDPESRGAWFHVFRRDTGERVGDTHVLMDGKPGDRIDADVSEALGQLPPSTRVALLTPQSARCVYRGGTEGHEGTMAGGFELTCQDSRDDGSSGAMDSVSDGAPDEAAERLDAGPQPQMTTPNKKEEADDILLT